MKRGIIISMFKYHEISTSSKLNSHDLTEQFYGRQSNVDLESSSILKFMICQFCSWIKSTDGQKQGKKRTAKEPKRSVRYEPRYKKIVFEVSN